MIEECYPRALGVLRKNSTRLGFKASYSLYNSIWGRDGCITCLGANLTGDKKLIETSRKTLDLLKRFQTESGQILNAYHLDKKYKLRISWYSSDSTLWFVIAVWNYFKLRKDRKFLREFWPSVKKAMSWIEGRKYDRTGLIDTLPASDWVDSSLQRQGKVLYNNCLFYKAVEASNKISRELNKARVDDEKMIKLGIDRLFWPIRGCKNKFIHHPESEIAYRRAINPKREYYLSHVIALEVYDDICDVFANSLAILCRIADRGKTKKILKYFLKKRLSEPYPIRVLDKPVDKNYLDYYPSMDEYREGHWQNLPFHYHNAGIWPYVGGFYVLALLKAGRKKKAEMELEKLAEANQVGKKQKWEFNEWLHGKTGKPSGAMLQSWSAAGYIMAYKAVVEGINSI